MFKQEDKDFHLLVNTAYEISNGGSIQHSTGYKKTLVRTLREVVENVDSKRKILKEDIVQQLSLMWIEYNNEFDKRNLKMPRKEYLVWRSIMGLRDWLRKEIRIQLQQQELITLLPVEPEQKIDVHFLVSGSKIYPFSFLSSYERYVLFLRFYKDMNIKEIASLMNKSRPTVHKHLTQIIEKLRRLECNSQKTIKKIT